MLHLCYSNRLEALCAPLAARVRAAQRADPLSPIQILVPNPAVEQFLRFELAEQNGIAANLDVGLIRRFLGRMIESADPTIEVLDKDRLQLVLYARLQRPEFLKRHRLDSVAEYLEYARSEEERQRRAFLLAGALARLFEEYGYSRRSLLDAWDEGRTTTRDNWLDTERWQRRLWRALFDRERVLVGAAVAKPAIDAQPGLFTDPHVQTKKHMMLMDAFERLSGQLSPPASLHIFGISYVSTAFAQVFARLASETELFVYAQNPCMEFWEDLQGSGLASLRSDWARRNDPFAMDPEASDPFDLESFADTPALRLWARPGREYIRLLNALSHCEFAPGFVDPTAYGDTLLARIQRDILTRTPESEIQAVDTMDESIQFLPCPSITREVEAVAERIWSLVQRPPIAGEGPLRFHEIAVFVTDGQRERYLAHIADTFSHRDGIPFRILDQTLSHGTGVLDCIHLLLRVLGSRFERSAVLDLLMHPQFQGPPMQERSVWRRWLEELNVHWGISEQDYDGTYLANQRYDWASNLERLLLGQFSDDFVDSGSRETPWGVDGIITLPTTAENRPLVGLLLQAIRDLSTDAQAIQRTRMCLKDWCALMGRVLLRYIQVDGPADESALAQCMRALDRLGERDLEQLALPFPIIDELLTNEFNALDSRRGQHRADGVVVSSLMPMRAIPFRAVFVLGLGEGQFPSKEVPDPLDLRLAKRHVGDVSAAERDRYIFLETLLAARESLCLSWVARDQTNGEPIEASPVVKEFEYVLRSYVDPEVRNALTVHVPRTRHQSDVPQRPGPTERYHRALETLWTSSQGVVGPAGYSALLQALQGTEKAALASLFRADPIPEAGPPKRVRHISMKTLERFLTSPLQGSAQYSLGLYDRSVDDPASDTEPMDLSFTTRRRILDACFWGLADDHSQIAPRLNELMETARKLGETPAGLFADAAMKADAHVVETWFRNASELGLTPMSEWKTVAIGPCSESTQFDHQIPPLSLPIDSEHLVWVHGVAVRMHPDRHAMMRCVTVQKAKPAHYLSAFLSLVVLAASGARFPDIVRVIINCVDSDASPDYRDYRVPPRAVCQGWLTDLSLDLLSGFHGYRLPVDVVMTWFNRRQRDADVGPYLPPHGRTADDRGPIADLTGFSLPSPDEASAMVARRYDLWFRAGHR